MIVSLLAAALLLADAPAAAPPAAPQPAPEAAAKPKPKANKDGMVCRAEASLGTRLPAKRCRTVAQAEAEKANGRDALEAVQRATPVEQTSN